MDVIAEWDVESRGVALKADHFVLGWGATEVSVPLTERSYRVTGLDAGHYGFWLSCVDAAGNQLADPLIGAIDVDFAPIPIALRLRLG